MEHACPYTLKISCWNIQGYKSHILGNKLNDPDFLSEINDSDVVGILETHIYNEILEKLDIAGFTRLTYKNRKKFKKENKSSVGIALFIKHKIVKLLDPFKTKNEDIIWLKLKKQYHGNPNDIYLGSVYLSEENGSQSILEKINKISEDVEIIKSKGGDILLQGDFNARTSTDKDFVNPDKFDFDVDAQQYELPQRNSTDKETNSKGKELLDLCKTYNLCIINGRKTGDHLGNLTSFQWGGGGGE